MQPYVPKVNKYAAHTSSYLITILASFPGLLLLSSLAVHFSILLAMKRWGRSGDKAITIQR